MLIMASILHLGKSGLPKKVCHSVCTIFLEGAGEKSFQLCFFVHAPRRIGFDMVTTNLHVRNVYFCPAFLSTNLSSKCWVHLNRSVTLSKALTKAECLLNGSQLKFEYHKIPIISPGLIFGLIFWGAYFWRGLLSEGILHFKMGWG